MVFRVASTDAWTAAEGGLQQVSLPVQANAGSFQDHELRHGKANSGGVPGVCLTIPRRIIS